MELTNEISRVKKKLTILEEAEGINWLLLDFINMTSNGHEPEDVASIVEELKLRYKKKIEENKPKSNQQKLFT